MKKDIKPLLQEAFSAPAPKNKNTFLKNLRPREISIPEMLLQQAAYIGLPAWVLTAAVVLLAVLGALLRIEAAEHLILMLLPFTAAIAVLENGRSARHGMTELESVTRFSLRSVLLARMTVLGIAALLALCISAPLTALSFQKGILLTAARFLVPYLVTMIVSLRLERSGIGRQTGYSSLAVASVISLTVYLLWSYEPLVLLRYLDLLKAWGLLIVPALLLLTLFEQWKTIHTVEAFA